MKDNFATVSISCLSSLDSTPLASIPDAPETLYYKGAVPLFDAPRIAIVGTRRASKESISIAREWSRVFARHGCVVVSGLARGIDAAAHQGALDEKGVTWAVLAHGLDTVYPAGHLHLASTILSYGGTLFSEYPVDTPSFPSHFLARNRIISGFSDAVIVIQAPMKSGAMATAAHATKQGRPVFVVPGAVGNPAFEGSHILLKKGALLVTTPDDIFSVLSITPTPHSSPSLATLSPEQASIIRAIASCGGSAHVDKIVDITTLSPKIVTKELMNLVLEDVVIQIDTTFRLLRS